MSAAHSGYIPCGSSGRRIGRGCFGRDDAGAETGPTGSRVLFQSRPSAHASPQKTGAATPRFHFAFGRREHRECREHTQLPCACWHRAVCEGLPRRPPVPGLAPVWPSSPHAGPTGPSAPAVSVSSEAFLLPQLPHPRHPLRSFLLEDPMSLTGCPCSPVRQHAGPPSL